MAVPVVSNPRLAEAVEATAELVPAARIVPVPELGSPFSQLDSVELLGWMGWMTAGPPTLAAEALRSAGGWALLRYRWALGDARGLIKPTADTQVIRQHTRSLFSETVGVGTAGYLACSALAPPGLLGVINLDDSIEPLLEAGVIRRVGTGKKQPDYLLAGSLVAGPLELTAIECKGTVKSESMAIGQLAAGARQVLGVESGLPMRRVVFATSLALDGKEPELRCHAIEVEVEAAPALRVDPEAAREALRDAALVRALRSAGRYDAADRASEGYFPDVLDLEPTFSIGGRPMVGHAAEVVFGESRLHAEVGVDLELLRALAAPRPERGIRVASLAEEITPWIRRREPVREVESVREEALMRDGIGILFEQQGRVPDEGDENS